MAKKHHKSQRNIPELYDQVKQAFSFSLTPTAVKNLEEMAKSLGLSRSEFVEQIARGILKLNLTTSEQSQLLLRKVSSGIFFGGVWCTLHPDANRS